jgi:hypothetical protein
MLHSASGAEKEKGKWHDEAGMTAIRGLSSLGALLFACNPKSQRFKLRPTSRAGLIWNAPTALSSTLRLLGLDQSNFKILPSVQSFFYYDYLPPAKNKAAS